MVIASRPWTAQAVKQLRQARRVLVIGPCGAGKSTLATKLAEVLGLPAIHLDARYWRPGWVETPQPEWRDIVRDLVAGERWVMDGNFASTFELRVPRADVLVVLDLPRRIYAFRVLWRVVTFHGIVRPDLAPGCPERFDWEFFRFVWSFHKHSRPTMLEAAASAPSLVLRRRADVAALERALAGSAGT